MKFTKQARTLSEIFDLSLGGQSGGHFLSCLYAPLTQTFSRFFGFFGIIAIFASEINDNTIMKRYTYTTTHDYYNGLEWVLFAQSCDNISFRFIFRTYGGVSRSAWMSPKKSLYYMRYFQYYFGYSESFTVVKRTLI